MRAARQVAKVRLGAAALDERRLPTGPDQPFPKVDPACDLVALLVEFEASFAPAFDSAAFEGFAFFPTVSLLSVGCRRSLILRLKAAVKALAPAGSRVVARVDGVLLANRAVQRANLQFTASIISEDLPSPVNPVSLSICNGRCSVAARLDDLEAAIVPLLHNTLVNSQGSTFLVGECVEVDSLIQE